MNTSFCRCFMLVVLAGIGVIPGARAEAQAPKSPATPTQDEPKPAADTASLDAKADQFVEPGSLKVLVTGFAFSEGPLYRNGELIVCDLGGNKMYSVAIATGEKKILRDPSDRAAGAAIDAEGGLLVTHFAGKLSREPKGGSVVIVADKAGDKPFSKLNDLAVAAGGVVFFTDFGGGREASRGLFSWNPNAKAGEQAVKLLDAELAAANGVALSPDQKTLYVAEYGAGRVKAYDVGQDASISNGRKFVDLSGESGAGKVDGMKTDTAGNLWTTGPGGVFVISPKGEKLARIALKSPASNIGFGGPEGKTLFITAGADVFTATLKRAAVKAE